MSDSTPVPVLLPVLTDLAQRINEQNCAAEADARSALQHALEAGRLLKEAKAQCEHGQWLAWLAANTNMSSRRAQEYMRLADNGPTIEEQMRGQSALLTIDGALKMLWSSKEPSRAEQIAEAEREILTGMIGMAKFHEASLELAVLVDEIHERLRSEGATAEHIADLELPEIDTESRNWHKKELKWVRRSIAHFNAQQACCS